MALAIIRIPTGPMTWVMGECMVAGYQTLILADKISYSIAVKGENPEDRRRTVHMPSVSEVTIQRKVDMSTADLSRFILTNRVSQYPWEIYFLKALGGGILNERMQVRYMTMKLDRALVINQTITAGEDGLTETLEVGASAIEWEYVVFGAGQVPMGFLRYKFDVQTGTLS